MRQKHDERYKTVFSSPIFIELLLKSFVHEHFIKGLDFSKLTKLDKSFVDKKMQNRESDLVWNLSYRIAKLLTIIYRRSKFKIVNPPSLCESMLNFGGSCFFRKLNDL